MKIINKTIAPLASLEVQNRYMLNGTEDNYILPEDLLNTAINVLFEQHAVRLDEPEKLKELKAAIRACDIPEGMSTAKLISGYEPWIKVRETARRYLLDSGFDLRAWEQNELSGRPHPEK